MMTIKTTKAYDQHAHEQPTQATEWAKSNAPAMGADTRKLLQGAAKGERPWHESYDATAARAAASTGDSFPHYGSQDASIRRGYQPGNEEHNVALSREHMSLNDPSRNHSGDCGSGCSHGGGLRPKRLTGAEMDAISPGWTDRMYERAQRPDGGNG